MAFTDQREKNVKILYTVLFKRKFQLKRKAANYAGKSLTILKEQNAATLNFCGGGDYTIYCIVSCT